VICYCDHGAGLHEGDTEYGPLGKCNAFVGMNVKTKQPVKCDCERFDEVYRHEGLSFHNGSDGSDPEGFLSLG
jgi:hypothetical protein